MGVTGAVVLGILVVASSCSTRSLEAPRDAGGPGSAQGPKSGGGGASGSTAGGRGFPGPTDAAGSPVPPADAGCGDGPASGGNIPGCSGTTADAGAPTAVVAVRLASHFVGPLAGSADAIAADDAGVYWLNHNNELWMLDETEGAVPLRLASDARPSSPCESYGRLAVADDQLFWVAERANTPAGALHRTTKTGDDVVLVDGIYVSDPVDVVVDGDDIYWNEGEGSGTGPPSTFVRTLPRAAAPGTNPGQPVTVAGHYAVAGVTVIGSDLYWSTIFLGGTMSVPSLQRADLNSIRQGMAPPPTPVARAWRVRGHDGNLYLGQILDLGHTALTRMPQSLGASTSLAVFADEAVVEIAFLDHWALTSVGGGGCGSNRYRLLAVPTDAAGGPVVQLAADLVTPAVLGRELSFVDTAGILHLASIDDVRRALGNLPPSPSSPM